MKVLKEAGIVSTGSGSSRRKRKVASAKHIIFVDDETAGELPLIIPKWLDIYEKFSSSI
jgi:hypothetical protein